MNWTISIGIVVAFTGLIWSIVNTLIGRYVATKITTNDLVHLDADVKELKEDEKDFKKEIKTELHQVNLSMNRIEKRLTKREALCEERHSLK